VRVDGREAGDSVLCEAFERVEAARGTTPLTYFEFGTLAALQIFYDATPHIAVLEVGLGGRLDAVNVVDCDVALLTGIGIDHCQWLGHDRESIGYEKAGIMRAGRQAVCSDPHPPHSVITHARALGASLARLGEDYGYSADGAAWSWWYGDRRRTALPLPALHGTIQLQNAAGVLAVVHHLQEALPVAQGEIREGLAGVRLPGRFQVIPGSPERIMDVAHNPHAAAVLAAALRHMPCRGRTHAVFAMLEDKDVEGVVHAMAGVVDAWLTASLSNARGASSQQLAAALAAAGNDKPVFEYRHPAAAYINALQTARPEDRILVFGSFYTVAAVLQLENGNDNDQYNDCTGMR
jgi:dihydrofolate synthase / folylpolyglutamate synthase